MERLDSISAANLSRTIRYHTLEQNSAFKDNMKLVENINTKHLDKQKADVNATYKAMGIGKNIDYLV